MMRKKFSKNGLNSKFYMLSGMEPIETENHLYSYIQFMKTKIKKKQFVGENLNR